MKEHEFKKKWGQNWLKSTEVIYDLLEAITIDPDDSILEIGPGAGAITEFLPMNCKQVVAVEIDPVLVSAFREKFAHIRNLSVVEADVLSLDLNELIDSKKLNKIVGALPYNISKKIIEKVLLSFPVKIKNAIFIIQKEVAESYAGVGNKRSMLHHLFSCFYNIKIVRHIESSAFKPAPNVDSSLILFIPKTESRYLIDTALTEEFTEFLHQIYRNPRKKLTKNLSIMLVDEKLKLIYTELGLEENTRVEELKTTQIVRLFNFISGR